MPSNSKKPCRPLQENYNPFISLKEIFVHRRTSLNIPNLGHPTAMHLCQPPLVRKTNLSPYIPIFAKISIVMISGSLCPSQSKHLAAVSAVVCGSVES